MRCSLDEIAMRIKEFRAYRPPYHLADQVAGPPYDVLDCEEARVIVSKQGEKCFLRVNRPEVDLPNTLNPYDRMVYETGARNLEHFISQGWLAKDNRPSLYIYGQRWGDRVQYGLCAGVSVHDYAVGKIKKHEETQVVKEDDRTRLVLNQNANISPVLLAYQDCEAVNAIIQRVVEKEAPVARTQSGSGTDLVEHMVRMCVQYGKWIPWLLVGGISVGLSYFTHILLKRFVSSTLCHFPTPTTGYHVTNIGMPSAIIFNSLILYLIFLFSLDFPP